MKPALLLASFQQWCREHGEETGDNKPLRGMLEKTTGIKYGKTNGTRSVRGVGLKVAPGGSDGGSGQGGAGFPQ